MNENQSGQNNLLDTTDCLEAVGVFKGWKNFLFVIIVICLLLLQICFWLIDTGLISVPPDANIAIAGETQITILPDANIAITGETQITILPIMAKTEQDIMQDVNEVANEIASEPNLPAEPNEAMMTSDEPAEPNQPAETEMAADSNQPADPNETMITATEEIAEPEQVEEPIIETVAEPEQVDEAIMAEIAPEETQPSEVQEASGFLFGITFDHLVWVIRFVNAVLILTATL